MMRSLQLANWRAYRPVIAFGLVVTMLVISALMSLGDLLAMRATLGSERDMLAKIKERTARHDGKTNLDPRVYLVEATSDGTAAAELQRLVSDLLVASGADLQLKDLIPAMPDGDIGRLAIAVNFEIDEERLPDLLYAVENAKPALLIERLSLRVLAGRETATSPRLQGSATIISAWKAPL